VLALGASSPVSRSISFHDATVVSQFGKSFASDYLRDNQRSLEPSLSLYAFYRPAMVPITTIQGCNQEPAVSDRAQRCYTAGTWG
jgi:hypothetical protein